jgi:hypothetical protein
MHAIANSLSDIDQYAIANARLLVGLDVRGREMYAIANSKHDLRHLADQCVEHQPEGELDEPAIEAQRHRTNQGHLSAS